jgi:hypothetical protein
MSIADLVLAHTAPEQLARLVGRLSDPRDAVIVHVDRRSDVPEMLASRKLFARKLDLATEPAAYDALDAAAGVAPVA